MRNQRLVVYDRFPLRPRVGACALIASLVLTLFSSQAFGLDQIFSQTDVDLSGESQVVVNGSFDGAGTAREDGKGAELEGWKFWQEGYVIVPGAGRDGSQGIQCTLTEPALQYGAGQEVILNQEKAMPLIASGWSRAQEVTGSPDSSYSIYLDFIYQDGSNWFGQTANFSTGTHDWEQRRFVVVPQKPVKSVFIYPIFRGHAGTAYFDDFSLLELRGETYMFEGVAVRRSRCGRRWRRCGSPIWRPATVCKWPWNATGRACAACG